MGTLTALKFKKRQDARDLLAAISKELPDMVVVFYRTADGVRVVHTDLTSVTEVIGALQRAIMDLHAET